MRTVLVFGMRTDPHVERIAAGIDARPDMTAMVIDFRGSSVNLSVSDDGRFALSVDDIPVGDDVLVFDRSNIIKGTPFYFDTDEDHDEYAAVEWRALYRLVCGLYEPRVVNTLTSRACMVKPYQQIMAAKAGFRVPATLVSNDKASLHAFVAAAPDHAVLKSLSGMRAYGTVEGRQLPYAVMTMRVSAEEIAGAEEAELRACPHFAQAEIAKDHELRVVWVDGDAIAFAINSQDYRTTETDWRRGGRELDFTRVELDAGIHDRISRFMRSFGLFAGSLDLIVDQAGDVWFLECNNQGAWAWLDDLCDGGICRLYVDAIARRFDADAAPA